MKIFKRNKKAVAAATVRKTKQWKKEAAKKKKSTKIEPPPACFNLIDDCWEKILNLLPIEDILRMTSTCTQMEKICGNYASRYLNDLSFEEQNGNIRSTNPRMGLNIRNSFCKYISNFSIDRYNLRRIGNELKLDGENFSSLKTLTLEFIKLYQSDLKLLKNILSTVENINLKCARFHLNVSVFLSKYFTNLRKLTITYCRNIDFIFKHHFQKLEHLKIHPIESTGLHIDEFESFIRKHTELKYFECDLKFFHQHRKAFENNKMNIKFSEITLHFIDFDICGGRNEAIIFKVNADLLNSLEKSKCFKYLNLSINKFVTEENMNLFMSSLALLSSTIHIKNLKLFTTLQDKSVDSLVKVLTNIENLIVPYDKKIILSFMRNAANLKTIDIGFSCWLFFNQQIDLVELNEERRKLRNSHHQVRLYFKDKDYLNIISKPENSNLSHIRGR